MFTFNFFNRALVAAVLLVPLAVGDALAQRGRGGDRGGGGGGGQSSRSFSGGRGGGEGGSSRSFSGNRGGESRSFRGGRSGESRSYSGGSSRSSRSISGSDRPSSSVSRGQGESRSFSDRSRSGSDVSRSIPSRPQSDSVRTQPSFRSSDQSQRSISRGDRGQSAQRQFDQARRNEYQVRRPTGDEFRSGSDNRDTGRRDFDRRRDSDRRRDFDGRTIQSRDRNQFTRDFDRDRDFNRGDRDFRGSRDYENWRNLDRLGDRNRAQDQRDWSGRWRDGDRFTNANRIRDHWRRDRDWHNYPFRDNWWSGHRHGGWGFWGAYGRRYNNPWYWWTWATAPRVASWVTFGWPRYYYWDYGPGEYINYRDGVVYVNGQWYAPGEVYYDRTVQLVDQVPDLTEEQAAQQEWMPLGVFSVSRDGEDRVEVMVQLAVTHDGRVGGTAFDQVSNASYPIEGTVDQKSQRTIWSFTNDRNQRIVMETSLFNLTQNEATGLIHYGPDKSQVIQLVRLETPQDGSEVRSAAPDSELPAPAAAQPATP